MEGETRAWQLLAAADPLDVCGRALVTHPEGEGYILHVFGSPVIVDPAERTISGSSPEAEPMLTKMAYFSRLSILHYLLGARPVELSGRLVSPQELKSGQFFCGGSHALPLEEVATRFAADPGGFVRVATRFDGRQVSYGDAAMELSVFPRLPVTLVLWCEDEEFAARACLLFDDTCEEHLPADVLWSVAMMCALAMLC